MSARVKRVVYKSVDCARNMITRRLSLNVVWRVIVSRNVSSARPFLDVVTRPPQMYAKIYVTPLHKYILYTRSYFINNRSIFSRV